MSDRYAVPHQSFITNGAVITSDVTGRLATAGNTTLTLSTTGGAGTFTITLGSGCTGTITSGTATITDSPKALVAGANVITSNGAGNCTLNLTLGTASTTNTVNTWSAASGGVSGASIPTSADNVYFDANSFTAGSQTLTVDALAYCKDMDWTGAANSPTIAGSSNVEVYGNFTTILGMTWSNIGIVYLRATSGTQTITTNGLTINDMNCEGVGGTRSLVGNLTMASTYSFNVSGGTFISNDNTITSASVYLSGTAAKTLTLGASVINCTSWNYTGSNLTTPITANTATINITGTGALAGGNADYNGASFNLNGTAHTVSGAFTCANLTRTGTATNANSVTFTSGTTVTVSDTFTLTGNSRANQLLAQSSTLGTAATIHATNWVVTNTDLMDITADTHLPDFSAQTDVGDCGGNTGITFPAGDAQTSKNTDNWSLASGWTGTVGDRVPLPQDNVTCSHSKTVDMPRTGKSISFTGTPTITLSNNVSVYGSLTLSPDMTYISGGKQLYMRGRGNYTLVTATKSLPTTRIYAVGGSVTLQDNMSGGQYDGLSVIAGTLDFNDYNVTRAGLFADPLIVARTIKLGNGIVTLISPDTEANMPKFKLNSTIIESENSTIVFSNSGVVSQTFYGYGVTYNNVTVQGAGAYALTVTGNNTFNTFTVDRSVANKTIVATGTTQTVNNFVCPVSGTRTLTLTNGTWTKTGSNIVDLNYMVASGVTGNPSNCWYMGINSTNSGGNTGLYFMYPPYWGLGDVF